MTNAPAHVEAFALKSLGLEALETRNSDGLDFHDVAVWTLREIIAAAYEAGRAAGAAQ